MLADLPGEVGGAVDQDLDIHLGVMAGQAHACSKEGDQPKVGQSAIDLATQVSLHFGLQAAFVFSGSFGYGMGHEFDRKTCPQALEDFKALQAKYLGG